MSPEEKKQIIDNRYLIINKIGDGGFATVYKAWDNMLRKFVAIKKIHKEYSDDAKFVDMFQKEAVNTAKIEHENVVRVINFIKDESGFYIIMDYVSGVDLKYLIDKCKKVAVKIPYNLSLYIILEVIKGLDSAHTIKDEITGELLNIVHCDISPGNIMLYFDGRVKLTDFGIARCGDNRIKASEKGKLRGKISYMSPEQARGDDIDKRSDLFGCGVVIYELLTGEKAFRGDTDLDILQKVKAADIDFKKLKVGVPDNVQEIIRKALQKSPDKRYQNATEMFIEIKRYLSKKTLGEELKKEYIQFITDILKDEIKLKEAERIKESEIDFSSIEKKTKKMQILKVPSIPVSVDVQSVEEVDKKKEKTVFDFVLDTAKRYKKMFISTGVSIVIAFIIYTTVDTAMQLTSWGIKINNIIWPPAFKINTVPSGVRIELIKDNINIIEREGYRSVTPSNISKISPGVYVLKLFKEGYEEITRKVTVFAGDEEQNISIAGAKVVDGIYIIPLEIPLEIDSIPSGATLFIGDKKIGETPFVVGLEVGKQYNFRLFKDGFEELGTQNIEEDIKGICILDTLTPIEEQGRIDFRFWDVKKIETKDGHKKFKVIGSLWKNIFIESIPSGALVYINDLPESKGITPLNLSFLAGEHNIKVVKKGYQSVSKMVIVDAESSDNISILLKKRIKIYAYGEGAKRKDIGAKISIRGTNIRGKTPFTAILPSGKYTFILEKNPAYKPVHLIRNIDTLKGNRLNISMELRDPRLHVGVRDYATGDRIEGVMVWVNDIYWKRTSKLGIAAGYIQQPPGDFKVEIKLDGYEDIRTMIFLNKGESKKIELELGAPSDGTIIVDTSDFPDALIYINGEYKGEKLQQVSDLSRMVHIVEVKSRDLNENIMKKVKINEPNQLVIIKLVSDGQKIYLKEVDPEIYWQQHK